MALAADLITRWNTLKEVFRIPKKARKPLKASREVVPPVATPPPPPEKRSSKRVSRWDNDEGPLPPPKLPHHDYSQPRHNDEGPLPPPKLPHHDYSQPRHSDEGPLPPPKLPHHDYSQPRHSSRRQQQQQSVLGPSPLAPLQNTVIVQQSPGHHSSVYVQQHLYTAGPPLHTQYIPPPTQLVHQATMPVSTASTQPLLVHQATMPVSAASTQPLLVHQATMPVSAAHTQPLLVHQATMPVSTASTQPLLVHQATMPVSTASTQPLLIPTMPAAALQVSYSSSSLTSHCYLLLQAAAAGHAGPALLHYPTGPSPLLPTPPNPVAPPPVNIMGGITTYQLPPPPPEEVGLPVGWKCARDQTGKVHNESWSECVCVTLSRVCVSPCPVSPCPECVCHPVQSVCVTLSCVTLSRVCVSPCPECMCVTLSRVVLYLY